MASTIAAITTGIGGIVTTADATGNLSLLSGTSTVVAVTSAGAAVTGTMSVSGNVGIGTASPITNLTIYNGNIPSSTYIPLLIKGGGAGTANDGGGIAFSTASSSAITSVSQSASAIRSLNSYASESNGEEASLAFYTNRRTGVNTYTGLTEQMRIDSSGNLLIGTTTSPAGSKELVLAGDYIEGVVAIGTVTTSNTLSLANGTVQTATLTASTACTFTMPTAVAGKSFMLLLKQAAATGNGTATFTSVKWNGVGAPTITATAGKMDILSFISDGTNWYGSITQGFTP